MSRRATPPVGRAALAVQLLVGLLLGAACLLRMGSGELWPWIGVGTCALLALTAVLGMALGAWVGALLAGVTELGLGTLAVGVVLNDESWFFGGLGILVWLALALPALHHLGRIAAAQEGTREG